MKVILVNGSPHEKGCVYTALEEVKNELNKQNIDTEIFWVGVKPIAGCIACNTCAKTGKCVFDDVVLLCDVPLPFVLLDAPVVVFFSVSLFFIIDSNGLLFPAT